MDNIISRYNGNFPMKLSIQKVINYPFHYKDELRIILVLKGSIILTAVSGSIILKENDIDTISINEPASISMVDEDNVVAILSVDSIFAEKHFPDIRNITFNCNFDHFYPCRAQATEMDILKEYVVKLIWVFYKVENNSEEIESLLENLLQFIMTHFDDVRNIFENTSNMSMHFDRFRRIIDYILNNLENKITLQEIAKSEFLDFHYLSNEFNSRLSNSFYDTLNYYRILHSVKLLLGTDLSIRDISINSGFSATRYFYKYFKKYLECTPAEFRKINKKGISLSNDNYKELDKSSQLKTLEPYFNKVNYFKLNKNNMKCLEIDLSDSTKEVHPRYEKYIPISSAKNILSESYQKHLIEIHREVGFEYLKLLNLLSNEMDIYIKDKECSPVYIWSKVNLVLEFLNNLHIKPFIRLDLCNLSIEQYCNRIKKFLSNCVTNYGLDNVKTWIFEIPITEEYFHRIVDIVRSFSPNVRFIKDNLICTNNNYFFDTTYLASYIVNDLIHKNNTPDFIQPVGDENVLYDKNSTFSGSCSLITGDGLKKPSYYAYYLLSLLGDDILEKGEDFIITKKGEHFYILLCNFIDIDIWDVNDNTILEELYKKTIADKQSIKKFNIDIRSLRNCYRLVRYKLDYQHGSVFHNWLSMEKPRYINKYYKSLFNKAVFPKLTFNFVNEQNINLSSELLPWAIELIVLEKEEHTKTPI